MSRPLIVPREPCLRASGSAVGSSGAAEIPSASVVWCPCARVPRAPSQPVDEPVEALAVDELHGVVEQVAVRADAEDRHDIGVVQPARGACLAVEPRGRHGPADRGGTTLSATRRPRASSIAS